MDGTRGIGRAIVEDKKGLAFAGGQNALVELGLLPGGKLLGLVERQTGFHGKISFGEIEGLFQFQRFRHEAAYDCPFCASQP